MKNPLARLARPSQKPGDKLPAWPLGAVAASLLALSTYSTDASALALGRITVLSSLGEPLRAEIDVPQISAEEAVSLQTSVASPDAFKSAGLEYNPVVGNLRVSLQRQGDGRARLQVTGDKVVNDPFIDLVLEASWSSGRVVRSYTMLFDPPNMRQASATPIQAAQVPPVSAPPIAPSSLTPRAVAAPPPPVAPSRAAPAVAERKPARPTGTESAKVTVQPGDTAGRIAATHKAASVSLDQMLVALLQANPDAFIDGNINRIKSGAVLSVPSAEQAQAIAPEEARRDVVAQSRNFNDFRRKLAEAAPTARVAGADRKTAGSVQARVEEKRATTASPDKLTLSKGSVQGKGSETQIAQTRQAQETSQRVAELSRNINELARIEAASGATGASPAAGGASAAGATLAVPAAVTPASASAPSATAPVATASQAAAAASAAATPASTPAASADAAAPVATASAPRKPVPPPPVSAQPSFLDELLENPLIPFAAGGLIALLAGLGIYRARQRKNGAQIDSSFLGSHLQPDSFFGSSGGQRVDTTDAAPTGSSLMYSPSQLDAGGDVDPVAEADVYLAYGRDLQAEEILKEALRSAPGRMAIRAKLLEIYFKRRDALAYAAFAQETRTLSGGKGPEWEQICTMGRELDPANALYDLGAQPEPAAAPPASPTPSSRMEMSAAQPETMPGHSHRFSPSAAAPLDLDIDLEAPFDPEPSAPGAIARASVEFDLDIQPVTDPQALAPLASPAAAPVLSPVTAPAPIAGSDMLEFDLGSLSLELEPELEPSRVDTSDTEAPSAEQDPQSTKLALAQEFLAIGDSDGARALVKEVIAEASGSVKAKAERFLADLD
jgi:pilus assembly protein FimV